MSQNENAGEIAEHRTSSPDAGYSDPSLFGEGLSQLSPAELTVESDGKQDYLYAKGMASGARSSRARSGSPPTTPPRPTT